MSGKRVKKYVKRVLRPGRVLWARISQEGFLQEAELQLGLMGEG